METTPQERKQLKHQINEQMSPVFSKLVNVTIHRSLENAETRASGVYASIFVHESSFTREEQMQIEDMGFLFVENYSHVVANPDMYDDIDEVAVDDLSDAAEVETELIVELPRSMVE